MSRKYDNIPGYPGYYVTRSGKVYSRKSGEWTKEVKLYKW